jgi:hypothetical protein
MALLALVALAALALSGSIDLVQDGLLTMLPAVALALMMATRPYTGERIIARLRRSRRRPRTSAARAGAERLRPRARSARGGRLIAVALAGRAPPPALAGCR